jgi:hypothetical protein
MIVHANAIYGSDKLAAVSFQAEQAYLRLLGVADDWGRAELNLRKILARAYPRRPQVKEAHLRRWLEELEQVGLLRTYDVGTVRYFEWTNWKGVPPSRRRFRRCPSPPWCSDPADSETCTENRNPPRNPERNPIRKPSGVPAEVPAAQASTPSTGTVARATSPRTQALNDGVREVFAHWTQVMKVETPLDSESKRRIRARLNEGFSVDALKAAIDGCKASAWHMGANPDRKVFNDITTICRDGAQVRKLGALRPAGATTTEKPEPTPYFLHPEFIAEAERVAAERRAKQTTKETDRSE